VILPEKPSSTVLPIRDPILRPDACRSAGCARARIEPAAAGGRLELDIEAPLPGPIEILFGCADRPAGTEEIAPSGQRALDPDPPGLGPPTFTHLIVGLKAPAQGETYTTLADAARFRASPTGPPCRELTVLDVAPASQIGKGESRGLRAPGPVSGCHMARPLKVLSEL
jgi:hypothetical protein